MLRHTYRRAAKAAASQRLSELAGSAKGGIRTVDIRWEDFNFPCRREPCNVLHVDLTELERLDQRAHSTVRVVYGWYLSLLLVVCINCACGRCCGWQGGGRKGRVGA